MSDIFAPSRPAALSCRQRSHRTPRAPPPPLPHSPPMSGAAPPDPISPDAELLDGPLSDEPQMETVKHVQQLKLLLELCEWIFRDRHDVLATGNLTIFFSPEQLKRQDFRGPDFFLVLGTDPRPRNSWVVWNEGGRYPDLIVELLSRKTRSKDLGIKKQTYQDVFRTPEYYAFDPRTGALFAFELVDGQYRPRIPDASGRVWSDKLGHYLKVHEKQLRFVTREGDLVPTGLERGLMAEAAARQAEAAEQQARAAAGRAEEAEQRAERLAARLRALGGDPDAAG